MICAAPEPMMVILDDVEAAVPLVRPTLATVPLIGAVSVAESSADWACVTSSCAADTVLVPPAPPPEAPLFAATLPEPEPEFEPKPEPEPDFVPELEPEPAFEPELELEAEPEFEAEPEAEPEPAFDPAEPDVPPDPD